MSAARFDRTVLVWERGTYCSTYAYTAEEFNSQFSERQRTKLLAGLEVDGCVDLEAFYHRKTKEEAIA